MYDRKLSTSGSILRLKYDLKLSTSGSILKLKYDRKLSTSGSILKLKYDQRFKFKLKYMRLVSSEVHIGSLSYIYILYIRVVGVSRSASACVIKRYLCSSHVSLGRLFSQGLVFP
jgi:hypothetical protein